MVRSDPCLLVETPVTCRLHGGLSQPRGELHNPGDLALLAQFKSVIYLIVGVYVNLDSLGFALCVQIPIYTGNEVYNLHSFPPKGMHNYCNILWVATCSMKCCSA